jgi:hypothetical protein
MNLNSYEAMTELSFRRPLNVMRDGALMQPLAATTRNAFQTSEIEIKRGFERFGTKGKDAGRIATAALSQLAGALLLARTYRSSQPFRRVERPVKCR